ncbi:hypothetical protein ACIA8K_11655 [Catenuloplanes sp. NPDC051500]|uniref:hypothetical protein n=1 Tax=Catenuloplanes sp. NPDC051500 TaxID=3363959 RepID=UPI0037BD82B2
MPFDAHVLKILIASPGDTKAERKAVTDALHGWNSARAEREEIVLLPKKWESDAVPRLGGSAQGVINEQLVDKADIVIALFDSRIGMATSAAVSGTAEEIERAHAAGKPVHVYFSDEPIPRDADLTQVAALREFKDKLSSLGLLGTYASPEDLGFQARLAIESDLDFLNLGAVTKRTRGQEHALLRAKYTSDREQYTDSKGKIKYRTTNERLLITNTGGAVAEGVSVALRPLNEGEEVPAIHTSGTPNIIPHSDFSWLLLTHMGTAQTFEAVMSWNENGVNFSERQHVTQ